jgi:hypothetical protein
MIYQTTRVFFSDLASQVQSGGSTELRDRSSVLQKKAVNGSVGRSFGCKAERFALLPGVTNGHKRLLSIPSALTLAFYSVYMIYQTTYVFSPDLAARVQSWRSSDLRNQLSVSLKKALSQCVGTNFGCNTVSFSFSLILVVFLTVETLKMIDV